MILNLLVYKGRKWKELVHRSIWVLNLTTSFVGMKTPVIIIIKNVNTMMYCLRKLRSFGVSTALLATFYHACVCSALTFGIVLP